MISDKGNIYVDDIDLYNKEDIYIFKLKVFAYYTIEFFVDVEITVFCGENSVNIDYNGQTKTYVE